MVAWCCCNQCDCDSFDDTDTPDLDDDFSTDTTGDYTAQDLGSGSASTLLHDSGTERVYYDATPGGFYYQEFSLPNASGCSVLVAEADCYEYIRPSDSVNVTQTVGVRIANLYTFYARPTIADTPDETGDDYGLNRVDMDANNISVTFFEGNTRWLSGDTLRLVVTQCDGGTDPDEWTARCYVNGDLIYTQTDIIDSGTEEVASTLRAGFAATGARAEWDNFKVWAQDLTPSP